MARKIVWTCDWCGKAHERLTDTVREGDVTPTEVVIARTCYDACGDCLARILPPEFKPAQGN